MTGEARPRPASGSTVREEIVVLAVAFAAGLGALLIGNGEGTEAHSPVDERGGRAARNYSASKREYRYAVELPAGPRWSEPTERFRGPYDLLRTTIRRESGAVLVIDRTPFKQPMLGGEIDSSRKLPHPRYGRMTANRFHDSTIIPACIGARCVDVLVDDGEGGGWGVLAGGIGAQRAQALAARTARTLRLPGRGAQSRPGGT